MSQVSEERVRGLVEDNTALATRVLALEHTTNVLVAGLRKAVTPVKGEDRVEWVDANIIQLLLRDWDSH